MATKKSASKNTKTVHAKPAPSAKPNSNTKPSHSAKPTKSAKDPGNKNLIVSIIGAVAAALLIVVGIIALANSIGANGKNNLTVKDGDGNKITTEYRGFDDFSFRIKIPTDFYSMSRAEIEKKYGKQNAPQTVFSNHDNDVNIVIDPSDDDLTNDQVKTYLNTAKSVLKLGGEIIGDDYFTQGNHNIATMQIITNNSEGKYYNNMVFFSQNDKLTTVTFNCKDDVRNKWEPVAKFILKSIDFTK